MYYAAYIYEQAYVAEWKRQRSEGFQFFFVKTRFIIKHIQKNY